MVKSYYLPNDDAGKADLLDRLAARLPAYAEQLNLAPDEIAGLKADAASFRYTLSMHSHAQYSAKNWTTYKNLQRDGGAGNGVYPPTSLDGPTAPAAVPPGIIPRLTALVSRIKTAARYSEAVGQDLGIIGSVRVIDPSAWQPTLTVHQEGGHPVLEWLKGDADALEIWVERTPQAGFVLLDTSTDTRYADTTPIPATPSLWRYKAIYRQRDEQAGDWSGVVSLAVGG